MENLMMLKKRRGRPMRYAHLLIALDDEQVYSPALIAEYGFAQGLFDSEQMENAEETRLLVRHTLARLAKNRRLPIEGDGLVRLKGQSVSIGWKGQTWKAVISPDDWQRGEVTLQERLAGNQQPGQQNETVKA